MNHTIELNKQMIQSLIEHSYYITRYHLQVNQLDRRDQSTSILNYVESLSERITNNIISIKRFNNKSDNYRIGWANNKSLGDNDESVACSHFNILQRASFTTVVEIVRTDDTNLSRSLSIATGTAESSPRVQNSSMSCLLSFNSRNALLFPYLRKVLTVLLSTFSQMMLWTDNTMCIFCRPPILPVGVCSCIKHQVLYIGNW